MAQSMPPQLGMRNRSALLFAKMTYAATERHKKPSTISGKRRMRIDSARYLSLSITSRSFRPTFFKLHHILKNASHIVTVLRDHQGMISPGYFDIFVLHTEFLHTFNPDARGFH